VLKQLEHLLPKANTTLVAGNIRNHMVHWKELTRDPWVLNCVRGLNLNFIEEPIQRIVRKPYRISPTESKFVDKELISLLKKKVLLKVAPKENQWLSNIFLRPKPDGRYRMILDLTILNKLLEYRHFKMFNLKTATQIIQPHMFMATIDLKDAYYSLPVREDHKRFLRFMWRDTMYEYQVLPNGLSPGPRIFTKLLKPIFAHLGEQGHILIPYLDDTLVLAYSREACEQLVVSLCSSLMKLGFTLNIEKSKMFPRQKATFLGFDIDSVKMEVSLPSDKVIKMQEKAKLVLDNNLNTIQEVSELIGLMVAYTPAVQYSAAHYKSLELNKIRALKRTRGDFSQKMFLDIKARNDINWWLSNLTQPFSIQVDTHTVELFTDASLMGWGAHTQSSQTGDRWKKNELEHINVLELKAVLFGLQSLCKTTNTHIRVRTDSTTALAYIKNMGGTKSENCNEYALAIWNWAQANNNWLSVTHIPGVENVLADLKSRKFRDHLEWSLSDTIFSQICKIFGKPKVDLFASRSNHKLPLYVTWEPQPGSWKTDAFSFSWDTIFYYIFPPFSLLPRVLHKIQQDKAHAIVVAPRWTGQPWHVLLQTLALKQITFPQQEHNLYGPCVPQEDGGGEISKMSLAAYLF